jgi:hypothetical protein
VVTDLPANTEFYAIRGLTPGTEYEFTVAAHNAEGNSEGNPVVSAQTLFAGDVDCDGDVDFDDFFILADNFG